MPIFRQIPDEQRRVRSSIRSRGLSVWNNNNRGAMFGFTQVVTIIRKFFDSLRQIIILTFDGALGSIKLKLQLFSFYRARFSVRSSPAWSKFFFLS